jgi:hypothetical protein
VSFFVYETLNAEWLSWLRFGDMAVRDMGSNALSEMGGSARANRVDFFGVRGLSGNWVGRGAVETSAMEEEFRRIFFRRTSESLASMP